MPLLPTLSRRAMGMASGRWFMLPLVLAAFLLSGCAGPDPKQYAAQKPTLDLKAYFNGDQGLGHGAKPHRPGRSTICSDNQGKLEWR